MRLRLLCLALALTAGPLAACSCTPSVDESLRRAEVVFRGKLESRQWQWFGDAVFQVSRVWKGKPGERIVVGDRGDCGDCNGFWPHHLWAGAELVVFAWQGKDGVYRTTICSPTRQVKEAQAVLAQLGPGRSIR